MTKKTSSCSGRACVISGGGAMGAYAVGILKELKPQYDFVSGISTGALMAPLVALGQYDRLAEAYTSVTLDSIFSVSPFNKKGKLRVLHALKRALVQLKPSFGEMHRLKPLIDKFYTVEDHLSLLEQSKEVVVGALNISRDPHRLEIFTPQGCSHDHFKEAMYASCCFAPISEIAEMNGGQQYVDGGFVETITIEQAIQRGYKDIDVFVLRPYESDKQLQKVTRLWQLLWRLFKAMRYDVVYENLEKAVKIAASREDVTITVYYQPFKLTDNAMHFDRKQMQAWVELGQAYARDERTVKIY